MTPVRLHVVDFMDARPVAGARVRVGLGVFPVRVEVVPPGEGGPHKPTRVTVPDLARAVDLPSQESVSDANGRVAVSFDTRPVFDRLRRDDPGPDPTIRARLHLRVDHGGLQRSLRHVHGDIDDGDVVTRTIVLDHAKTIVGHTTTTAVTLWFALHGPPPARSRHHCEVRDAAGTSVRRERVTFAPGDALTATVRFTGLRPGTRHVYRLLQSPGPPVLAPKAARTTAARAPAAPPASRAPGFARGPAPLARVGARLAPAPRPRARPALPPRAVPMPGRGPTVTAGVPGGRRAGTSSSAAGVDVTVGAAGGQQFGGPEVTIAEGSFRTARAGRDRLDVAFASCHLPAAVTSLDRWRHLGAREEPDLLLLMGDQVYEDGIEELGDTWFERHVNRHHQFWTPHAVRDVLRRVPTYMVFDDHDVRDDWGTVPFGPAEAGREAGALRAYDLFQKAHGPGGRQRATEHYSFTRGPAAFFVLDGRTNRVAVPPASLQREHATWDDAPASTILGQRQLADLRAWARAPATRAADVVVLVSPVPLAFLPVQEVLRLIEELEDDARDTGGLTLGTILGAVGAGIGAVVAGPAGAVVGGLVGGAIGGAGGAVLGHSVASRKIEDEGFEDLTDRDIADLWTWEPHQRDLVAVLEVLFDLANDVRPDGTRGPRPRAVLVLGGDVHVGTMHAISVDAERDPQYRRQPLLWQVVGSPISKTPAPGGVFAQALRHITPGLGVSKLRLVTALGDIEAIAGDVFGDEAAHFPLDDRRGSRFHAELVDVAGGRNYGRLRVERVQGRTYRFFVTIEGEESSVVRAFEVDLDADPVVPREVLGTVLSVEGRVTLLRLQDLGHGFGPPTDRIDGEVVVAVDTAPDQAFGFTLRDDRDEAAHRGMYDLLRAALADDAPVRLDYVRTGLRNGRLARAHRVG